MKKKLMVFFMLMAMALASLTGCQDGTVGKTKVTLNEVAHSVFYAPMYVALEEGYFAEEGLEVNLVTGFGADKTMTALLSGEADIGFMGPETTLYTYQGDIEDYAVNFAQLTQRAGNFLVGRQKEENFSFADLKGKQVLGGRAGGMPQMVFEYILKKNGLDPATDLTIDQSIDFGSTAAAFSGGQGEYTIEFEPHATLLEQKGDGYVLASLGEESGYVPYTAFSAKKSYIEANPQIMEAFVAGLQKGMEYVNSHTPEEIAALLKPQFEEMEESTLAAIIARYQSQDSWKTDLVFEQEAFELLQDILIDANVLEERLPYENLVNTEFAGRAKE
ncbi:MAG: ABC transporter substrate-binding protein [Lachnospiraceae bacterium]|nr:ABC transporter substrate-binding protein [Lachnospiraceae bacterium]MDY5700328.1 ABC transporter substrate-binding protein [Lachnospiraceae bacterium]